MKRVRAERGFTQRSLARAAEITEKYLSRIEQGQVTPSSLVTFRLCSALGAELGELVTMRPVSHGRGVRPIVQLLSDRSHDDVDCARRILVELFRSPTRRD